MDDDREFQVTETWPPAMVKLLRLNPELSESTQNKLKALSHRVNDHGEQVVTYSENVNRPGGRLLCDKFGLHSCESRVRNFMVGYAACELDIKSCHPTMLSSLVRTHCDRVLPYLAKYVADPEKYNAKIQAAYTTSIVEPKKIVTIIINCTDYTPFEKAAKRCSFINGYISHVQQARELLAVAFVASASVHCGTRKMRSAIIAPIHPSTSAIPGC